MLYQQAYQKQEREGLQEVVLLSVEQNACLSEGMIRRPGSTRTV